MIERNATDSNKAEVMRLINNANGLSTAELDKLTDLTRNQIRNALHDLKQEGRIYEQRLSYYPEKGKLAPYVLSRVWNSQIFDGVAI